LYFDFPSKTLTVIAVTGTDGKTTTVNMIFHALQNSDKKVSMVSSVGASIGGKILDTGFHVSTPSPFQVQKLLSQANKAGSEYFILEATSHGLDQNRLAFVKINTAVLTNITSEHLDYHKTWQNYANAKAKLFKNVNFSVLNMDDTKSYEFIRKRAEGTILTYSKSQKSNVNLENTPISIKIAGDFNISNALASASSMICLGLSKPKILKALHSFAGVPGRMQEVSLGQKFTAIVDFAHTPNALESILSTLKQQYPKSKIISVFGVAGERDKSKRFNMGAVSAKFSDITIITSEDPRDESPESIAKDIEKGLLKHSKKINADYFIETDRSTAIGLAVKLAKSGDVVGFFGKGHEKSMCIGEKEYPYDEVKEVEKAIKKYDK